MEDRSSQLVQPRVLIVEDEDAARNALVRLLSPEFQVASCDTAEAAEIEIKRFSPDVLLTDVRLPGASGLTLVQKAKTAIPECIVLVMTAYTSVETAVEAMRAGARDFIIKPINFDALELVLRREIDHQRIALEAKRLREELHNRIIDAEVWGESAEMQAVLRGAADVAQSNATVLITGESGTGKEVLARFLHRCSHRANGPFVAVNCAAIPETLLESEFFGHEKGAFTGAVGRKLGRFERANGGTIFLDEIGDLSPGLQVKMLRVLQERQVERVGGTEPIELDVRVIAATNQDLDQAMRERRFREDLFYRLNVIQLDMPALRERKADIGLLWEKFVGRFAQREGREPPETTSETLHQLYEYDWPGNVRELENVAERAVILSRGQPIQPAHLPATVRTQVKALEDSGIRIPGSTMAEIEKTAILKTLAVVGGSTSRASKMLGISARKIQYRLREWRSQASGGAAPSTDWDSELDDEPSQPGTES
jgi:two-component system NtrC family response regulator/two-component system response regulator HydG